MWAIYFVEPENGRRFACNSSGHWWFVIADEPVVMALFAQEKNASKAIRDHKDRAATWASSGYALAGSFTDHAGNEVVVSGADDFSNYRVVPMIMTPNFENAISDFRTPAQKKKDERGG